MTTGEPGKDDILFAGRLVRHAGAHATLLSVVERADNQATRQHAERFLQDGIRSLEILGVPAQPAVRSGVVSKAIAHGLAANDYDLLVLGTPLADRDGYISLKGVVEQVLSETATCATLLVRSQLTAPRGIGRRQHRAPMTQRRSAIGAGRFAQQRRLPRHLRSHRPALRSYGVAPCFDELSGCS